MQHVRRLHRQVLQCCCAAILRCDDSTADRRDGIAFSKQLIPFAGGLSALWTASSLIAFTERCAAKREPRLARCGVRLSGLQRWSHRRPSIHEELEMTRKFILAGAAVVLAVSLAGPVFAGANDYVF